jgi:hypothetical protein
MKYTPPSAEWKPRELTPAHWFWFLIFMGLVTRVPLLRMATAETTDGVYCLTYFSPSFQPNDRFVLFPGYPFLLSLGQWLGAQGWLLGRILSSLAGFLFLIPLWRFSRRWMSMEMSGVVCTMALFSPLMWQWSLKVMPDVFFLLLFWLALERLTASDEDRNGGAWIAANLAAAVAACTRPEGYLLFPWIWSVGEGLDPKRVWQRRLFSVLAWVGPFLLLLPKTMTILDAYREGTGMAPGLSGRHLFVLNAIEHLYTYLTQPVFVFTPLVFGAALLGLGKMTHREGKEGRAFRRVILQVYLVLFLSRLFPMAYQDRYLLPFLPLVLVAAGYQLDLFFEGWKPEGHPVRKMFVKNGLLTVLLAWSVIFSAAVMIAQNDSFGDIKRSAEALKALPPDAVIYSDEIPKTQYWSGRQLRLVTLPFNPEPGTYVVLHSFYTPRLGPVDQNMRERLGATVIRQDNSMLVPLLTDLMEDPTLQNRFEATAFRFRPQFFTTLTYHVGK